MSRRKYLFVPLVALLTLAILGLVGVALGTQGKRLPSNDIIGKLSVDFDWERDAQAAPLAQGSPGAAWAGLLAMAVQDRWQDVYGSLLPEVRQQVSVASLKSQLEPLLAQVQRSAILREDYQSTDRASVTLALGTAQPGKALLLVADMRRADGAWHLGYNIAPAPEGWDRILARPGDATLKSTHFVITHAGNEALARQTAAALEGDYDDYTKAFGASPTVVHVYLAPDRAAFDGYLSGRQPEWVIGRATLGRIFLLDPSAWTRQDPATFPLVAKHEFVHFLVAEVIKGGTMPRWFHEGLASFLAGQARLTEELRRAALANQLPRLGDLFANQIDLDPYAYPLSWVAVHYIETSFGPRTAVNMVIEVGKGKPWAEVLRMATGIDEDALENAVAQYLKGQ